MTQATTRQPPDGMTVARPFWEGVQNKTLRLQFDPATGRYQFWPRALSLSSRGRPEWRDASGKGTLFAVTVMPGASKDDAPVLFGAIDLDEGVRILAPLRGVDAIEAKPGMAVRVAFSDDPAAPAYFFEPA
jgi:uncharacterized OB-fold protein